MEEPGSIELISIGIVSDDGRELYVGDLSRANDWVRANVLPKLPPRRTPTSSDLSRLLGDSWKPGAMPFWLPRAYLKQVLLAFLKPSKEDPVELWGYYSAYDHVVLCWLFGRMIDLPEGMPMYTRDMKQLCDMVGNPQLPDKHEHDHTAIGDARWTMKAYRFLRSYASDHIKDGYGLTL